MDIFNYILEDGLDVYLSNNMNQSFDIRPNINAMRELGLPQIADNFEFIKSRFDDNEDHKEGETWDEYKLRLGILGKGNSWDTVLIKDMADNFPYQWIRLNYAELTNGLNLKRVSH